jgi:hypothetical protein
MTSQASQAFWHRKNTSIGARATRGTKKRTSIRVGLNVLSIGGDWKMPSRLKKKRQGESYPRHKKRTSIHVSLIDLSIGGETGKCRLG